MIARAKLLLSCLLQTGMKKYSMQGYQMHAHQNGQIRAPELVGENSLHLAHITASLRDNTDLLSSNTNAAPCNIT